VTGTLVPPRDASALAAALAAYAGDASLRRAHGAAARARVLAEFRPEAVWEALHREYLRLLAQRGLPLPATGVATSVRLAAVARTEHAHA